MKKVLFIIGISLGFFNVLHSGSESGAAVPTAGLGQPWTLTHEELQSLPDEDVEWEIVDRVDGLFGESWSATLNDLPKGVRVVYTTWILEAEVYNGGFDQFFLNTDGEINGLTLDDLRTLGAHEHVALLERAMSTTNDLDALRALDDRFYELDSLQQRRIAYIRAHPEVF